MQYFLKHFLQVRNYLQISAIILLGCPGNSPDLNPIENCWHVMSNKIAGRKPANDRTLQEVIICVWCHELWSEYIKKLINLMPDRCKAVIKARGGPTKY
jgi:transposase